MVVKTISHHVIRQALRWSGIDRVGITFAHHGSDVYSAAGIAFTIVVRRFTGNNFPYTSGMYFNDDINQYVDDVRESFCTDIEILGWRYDAKRDTLFINGEYIPQEGAIE